MRKLIAISLAFLCFDSSPAIGQEAGHKGFHASVGVGPARAKFECDGCMDPRIEGGALMLRFGGAVSPRFVLSGELGGWSGDPGESPRNAAWLFFTTQFYPSASNGFFFKAGLGSGSFESTLIQPGGAGPRELKTRSGALSLGLGYDIPIRGGFSLTPYLDAVSIWQAAPENNGGGAEKRGMSLGYFGLAASWR
jgi:hypothetical protein